MGLENDDRLSRTPITTFYNLRKLDLKARDSLEDNLNPLLDRLSVPNLKELALSISSLATFSALAPGSATRLLKFLEASSFPPVAHQSLHNIGLSSSDVKDVFEVLSGVVTLDLSGASLNADILSLVSAHSTQGDARQCLPLLKSLVVDVKGRYDMDVKALLEAVCRRRSPSSLTDAISPIKDVETVVLINCPQRLRAALEHDENFTECRASGLDISFHQNHRE